MVREKQTSSVQAPETGGLEQKPDRDVIGAITFIFVGVVLLLNTTNYLPWEVWSVIWQFWPVMVIFVGLRLVIGKSRVADVLMGILVGMSYLILVVILYGRFGLRHMDGGIAAMIRAIQQLF